jgi:uncharacterized protein with HEPN domain
MPRHDLRVCLQQMLDHAREAIELVRGMHRQDLDRERVVQLALVRLIEIVGEAGRRVEVEDRRRYELIPWTELIGMRSRLIHGYDQVDLGVLWEVVTVDLPVLVKELERILAEG